jgi:tripartite-type tricarboxylate transporter receptor subunit TctC
MSLKQMTVGMLWTSVTVVSAGVVLGQDFPTKPLRIVTSSPGGGSDFTSRIIAAGLTRALAQPVITDNRVGDIIQGDLVTRALPDGHTLLVTGNSFWLVPFLFKGAPWDPQRDFSAVSLAGTAPIVLLVQPAMPVKSVKDLIALAQAKPGVLNYGSAGTGGSLHLPAELFKSMTGVNIVRVDYKGTAPAVLAVLTGEVQLAFSTATGAAPHLASGKLRALAVTSAQPSALFPGVPTIAASGLPGFEALTMTAVFAPAKTPAPVINRLNQEIVRTLNQPEAKEKFLNIGVEVAASSPQALAATVKSEVAKWGKLISDLGIRPE